MTRPLTREMRPLLGPWVRWWRKDLSRFSVDSLQWFAVGRFAPDWTGGSVDTSSVKVEWNALHTYAVDFDVYAEWDSAGQRFEDGEAHVIPALYDSRQRRSAQLVPGGWEFRTDDAGWLDNSRFVLLGSVIVDERRDSHPSVHLFDLDRHELIIGYGPPVHSSKRSVPAYRDERLARRQRERARRQ